MRLCYRGSWQAVHINVRVIMCMCLFESCMSTSMHTGLYEFACVFLPVYCMLYVCMFVCVSTCVLHVYMVCLCVYVGISLLRSNEILTLIYLFTYLNSHQFK